LVLWVCGSFLAGIVVGGLLTLKFLSPASTSTLPLPALLEEAHRFLDKGQLAEAEKRYQGVLVRDPGNPEALTHLGNVLLARGDVDGALSLYEEALRRNPSYGHALWDKGVILQSKGDDLGAIAAWEAFTRLFPPDSPDVIKVKSWIAEAQGRLGSTKGVILNPSETLKELSRRSSENVVKDKAAR
jgi:tetratricopeptide (TPR) repeat protein